MKRKKLARFLIAHNSFAQPEEVFILHTRKPAFIAQIHLFDTTEAARRQLTLQPAASVVQVHNLPVLLEISISFEEPGDKQHKILQQMAKWYYFAFVNPDVTPESADTELDDESAD